MKRWLKWASDEWFFVICAIAFVGAIAVVVAAWASL